MKHTLLSLFTLLLLLFSCQHQAKDKAPAEEEDETPKTELTTHEIGHDVASQRIKDYNNIYGDSNRQLEGDAGKVFLPRYFVINSEKFKELLQSAETSGDLLYASLDVKERPDANRNKQPVSNLIFHKKQPNSNGQLSTKDDTFLDYGNACPIDCEKPGGDPEHGGGYDGAPVDADDAVTRVKKYNDIYGPDDQYITSKDGSKKMLIARYFSFSNDDINKLLEVMKDKKHQFFYVSMGAEKETTSNGLSTESYITDLIFHYVRPEPDGTLQKQKSLASSGNGGDNYYDVTTPCPKVCPD